MLRRSKTVGPDTHDHHDTRQVLTDITNLFVDRTRLLAFRQAHSLDLPRASAAEFVAAESSNSSSLASSSAVEDVASPSPSESRRQALPRTRSASVPRSSIHIQLDLSDQEREPVASTSTLPHRVAASEPGPMVRSSRPARPRRGANEENDRQATDWHMIRARRRVDVSPAGGRSNLRTTHDSDTLLEDAVSSRTRMRLHVEPGASEQGNAQLDGRTEPRPLTRQRSTEPSSPTSSVTRRGRTPRHESVSSDMFSDNNDCDLDTRPTPSTAPTTPNRPPAGSSGSMTTRRPRTRASYPFDSATTRSQSRQHLSLMTTTSSTPLSPVREQDHRQDLPPTSSSMPLSSSPVSTRRLRRFDSANPVDGAEARSQDAETLAKRQKTRGNKRRTSLGSNSAGLR
ncbi:hypothetical protein OIO90_000682 [Microbotryomycetes sp. JL221]|nr:hypothetical protein OIO90_000682 [Microbotryomycetes sp. JL221]